MVTAAKTCSHHEWENEGRAQHPSLSVVDFIEVFNVGKDGRNGKSIHVIDEIDEDE